jgi:pimeloyl-ACP methyl ester carboxylesterase
VSEADPRADTEPVTVDGDGILFTGLRWRPTGEGPGTRRRAVLLHGVQSSAATMARTARALAADGWEASALDMPGHGTTRWLDDGEDDAHYERANAVRLVGAAVAALADRPALIGHSWGADTALAIAAGGARLERTVLIDPPALTAAEAEALGAGEIADLRPGDLAAARALIEAAGVISDPIDIAAKAEALAQASALAILAALRSPGAWQPLVDVRRHLALPGRTPLDVILGDPSVGGLMPWPVIGELRGLLGPERVHVLSGAGHSPQRTDFERFWTLLRRILG